MQILASTSVDILMNYCLFVLNVGVGNTRTTWSSCCRVAFVMWFGDSQDGGGFATGLFEQLVFEGILSQLASLYYMYNYDKFKTCIYVQLNPILMPCWVSLK